MRARANLFTRGLSYIDLISYPDLSRRFVNVEMTVGDLGTRLTSTLILFTMFTPVKPVMKFTPVRALNLRDSGNRPLGTASGKAIVTCR